MNPEKGRGEDIDPHGGMASSNNGKRTQQRQRNSPRMSNRRSVPQASSSNSCSGDKSPQQQPSQPQDFQRLPNPMHHRESENPPLVKRPPPQQWQYFTRYRPFGESVRPYQYPPPPHFPQQFQFGTFPGRNSPRFRHRRENFAVRGANDNSVHNSNSSNNNNDIYPNGNLHNNHPDMPLYGDAVRPKSGPFLKGKKRSNKHKNQCHDSTTTSRSRKNGRRPHETSSTCRLDRNSFSVVSDSLKENSFLPENRDRVKVSKSCDESWLDNVASESLCASLPTKTDAEDNLEGAVGGLPLKSNSVEQDMSPFSVDKDLIDEGAIFDLDKIFQNREISGKGDRRFTNGIDSGDELDFVFDCESAGCDEAKLSDLEAEGCSNVCDSAKPWIDSKKDAVLMRQMRSNASSNSGSGIHVCDVQKYENSNNSSHVHGSAEGLGLVDSDGGEDTGDFIDTDLPSHAKHILSSSDEMDNQSSSKESDDDDDNEKKHKKRPYVNRQPSVPQRKETGLSDFNSNDLSTLEPHLLNSLSHLSMKTVQSRERGFCSNSNNISIQDNWGVGQQSENQPSSAVISVAETDGVKKTARNSCGSSTNLGGACTYSQVNSVHASCPMTNGAAADNDPPLPSSCCPNCRGPDCMSQCSHSKSVNNELSSAANSHYQCDGTNVTVCSELSESSASNGIYNTSHSNRLSPYGRLDSNNASGTSVREDIGVSNSMVDNSAGSACHCMANGFVFEEMSPELANSFSFQNFSVPDEKGGTRATTSSAAEKELDENSDLMMMMRLNMESSSSSSSSVAGGMEDPLSFDSNGDHVDLVLLPMEEEIQPVLYGAGGPGGGAGAGGGRDAELDAENNREKDYTMVPNALSAGAFPAPCYTTAGVPSHHHSMGPPSCIFEDRNGPRIRDPISIANRLPSKEFYELIKTVSSTDSYMRFFDKDGQDVQRSSQKTSNDEDTPSSVKGNSRQSKKSSRQRSDCLKVDRVMIWNEYEAYVVQYKQIAVSACGQTAVLNVLKALKYQCEKSIVCKVIKTNLRKEDKDIPEYLFSRTCAGTTAVELMSGVERLTGGVIGGRFFNFWPPRKVKLLQWLAYWMKRGAIPMATLNLQQGPHSVWEVPDSWHHQMVYGVSHQGLYLTNPLEIVSERSAVKQLHSDSVLLVRRQDIVSRFRESTDLGQLLDHPDPRWVSMNVLGQVVNVLRECNMPSVPGYRLQVTSHVKIPASYQAGITLFMRKEQPAWNALVTASELPLE